MSFTFTNAGEFSKRGKGRLGRRVRIEDKKKGGGKKQHLTPDQIALNKLFNELDKPGMTLQDRYYYRNLMENAEQIRFMNMKVLAAVLLYMHSVGNVVSDQTFNYNTILPSIEILMDEKQFGASKNYTPTDLQIIKLRLAVTFLRYIHYVTNLIAEVQANFDYAEQNQQVDNIVLDEI